ncbi:MAG TPA: TOBE domain-containing protein, partial [Gemmatimonadaceae bacterium]|nr:TOBE domain-containing protein [Gemmatimonadaceae bacterium]
THDQEDAFAIADRIAMLQAGALLQVGTPDALYDTPATADVARFIGRGTLLPAVRAGAGVAITVGGITQQVALAREPAAADRSRSPRAGGERVAVLRPEMLALGPGGDAAAWPGVVTVRRFAGGHFAYTVQPSAPETPSLEIATADGAAREGDAVSVRVTADAVALVEA